MKIYIVTDMEGISGIRRGDKGFQVPDTPTYPTGQRLLTADVNAAVEGALEGGAKEIVVNDGHGGGSHILVEQLHPEAKLESAVSGRNIHYMPSLNKSFAAMFVIGAHAMAGTRKAFLDHTQSSKDWYNYYLNGKKYGEIGQYALAAGYYDVPVVLVSGDLAAIIEAKKMLGNKVELVAVKEALSRNVAKSIHPSKAHVLIKKAALKSMSKIGTVKPLKIKAPIEVKLEFQRTELADDYEGKANIKRIDARTISCKVNSQLDILNF